MAPTAPPREPTPAVSHAIERPTEQNADLDALFPGRYLSITTFKRDGTGVATPVWFVSDGTRLFAFTDLHSAKIRRIHHNPRVLVASCWVNGKPRREPVAARAEVITDTSDLGRIQKLLLERYKISYRVVMLFYRLGRRLRGKESVADGAALAITLEAQAAVTKEDFNRQARRAAFLTVALAAALVFGVIVLAGGDWLPGGLIVASSAIGLGSQISVIRKLCRKGPAPAPPRSKPAS